MVTSKTQTARRKQLCVLKCIRNSLLEVRAGRGSQQPGKHHVDLPPHCMRNCGRKAEFLASAMNLCLDLSGRRSDQELRASVRKNIGSHGGTMARRKSQGSQPNNFGQSRARETDRLTVDDDSLRRKITDRWRLPRWASTTCEGCTAGCRSCAGFTLNVWHRCSEDFGDAGNRSVWQHVITKCRVRWTGLQ